MYRPTSMHLFLSTCPYALDLYEQNAPYDRRVFGRGTAAHEFLHALGEGRDVDDLYVRLMSTGRTGDDAEGPLVPDDVQEGKALAFGWVEKYPIEPGARFEERFAFDDAWQPVAWDSEKIRYRTRIDKTRTYEDGDADEGIAYSVIAVTDYKTSWQDDETALDVLQRKFQAVCVWKSSPGVEVIRLEVSNLRRMWTYARDVALDEEGTALLESWQHEIELVARAMDVKPRTARPGVGCLKCPYVPVCTHAKAAMESSAIVDGPSMLDRYLAADAIRSTTEAWLREATHDHPIVSGAASVGSFPTERGEPIEGAAMGAVRAFVSRVGSALSDDATNLIGSFFASAGEPGMTWLRDAAKAILPDRKAKVERDAWVAAHSIVKLSPRWKVEKPEAEEVKE